PPRPARRWRRIGGDAGNREGDLGTHSLLAPDFEGPADLLGTLTHPRQTKAPGSATLEYCRFDASAVVADAQFELPVVIPKLHFNATGACVPERIAQGLARNPVDIVPDDRTQRARHTSGGDLDTRRRLVRIVDGSRGELFAQRAKRGGEIVHLRRRRAEVLDGVTSFPHRPRAMPERSLQSVFGFRRSIGKDVGRALKPKHDAVKALQQRIVQLARDARPLVYARLQLRVECTRDLTETELVQRPQQRECRGDR